MSESVKVKGCTDACLPEAISFYEPTPEGPTLPSGIATNILLGSDFGGHATPKVKLLADHQYI
jgi:hypothetical protein